MALPHEEQEEEGAEVTLELPNKGVARTKEVDDLVGKLSTALDGLLAKQRAHADAISAIGDLLGSPLDSVQLQLTLNDWPDTSEEAATSIDTANNQRLQTFKDHALRAAIVRAAAYEEAHGTHKDAKAKLQKPDKKKKAALEQAEREARSKAQAASETSTEQLRLMEEDYETTLLNATRDLLHGQLLLHAKGVEAFTKAMQQIPAPKR